MNVQAHCDPYFEELQAYLDNELPPADRSRVAEHVAGCEACRATLDDLKAVSGALGSWAAPEPRGLPTARELMARAAAGGTAPARAATWWTPGRRWAAAAAAVVLTAGAGLVALRTSGERDVSIARRGEPAAAATPAVAESSDDIAGEATNANTLGGGGGGGTKAPAPPAAPPAEVPENQPAADTDSAKDAAEPAPPPPPAKPAPTAAPGAVAMAPAEPTVDGARASEDKKKEVAIVPAEEGRADEAGAERDGVAVAQAPAPAAGARSEVAKTARRGAAVGRASAGPSLRLDAEGADAAADRVSAAAVRAGGRVQSRSAGSEDGRKTIRLVVAVPAGKLESTLAAIRGAGHVRRQRSEDAEVQLQDSGAVTVEVLIVERGGGAN